VKTPKKKGGKVHAEEEKGNASAASPVTPTTPEKTVSSPVKGANEREMTVPNVMVTAASGTSSGVVLEIGQAPTSLSPAFDELHNGHHHAGAHGGSGGGAEGKTRPRRGSLTVEMGLGMGVPFVRVVSLPDDGGDGGESESDDGDGDDEEGSSDDEGIEVVGSKGRKNKGSGSSGSASSSSSASTSESDTDDHDGTKTGSGSESTPDPTGQIIHHRPRRPSNPRPRRNSVLSVNLNLGAVESHDGHLGMGMGIPFVRVISMPDDDSDEYEEPPSNRSRKGSDASRRGSVVLRRHPRIDDLIDQELGPVSGRRRSVVEEVPGDGDGDGDDNDNEGPTSSSSSSSSSDDSANEGGNGNDRLAVGDLVVRKQPSALTMVSNRGEPYGEDDFPDLGQGIPFVRVISLPDGGLGNVEFNLPRINTTSSLGSVATLNNPPMDGNAIVVAGPDVNHHPGGFLSQFGSSVVVQWFDRLLARSPASTPASPMPGMATPATAATAVAGAHRADAHATGGVRQVQESHDDVELVRMPGMGLFYTETPSEIPPVFYQFVNSMPALFKIMVFVHIRHTHISHVLGDERIYITKMPYKGFYNAIITYGYLDEIDEGSELADLITEKIVQMERRALASSTTLVQSPTSETVPGIPLTSHLSTASTAYTEDNRASIIYTRPPNSSSTHGAPPSRTSNPNRLTPEQSISRVLTARRKGVTFIVAKQTLYSKTIHKWGVLGGLRKFLLEGVFNGMLMMSVPLA
ncbi:hypothetical protein HK102_009248, partial [Quaeritorhiza haematococci]